MKRYTSDEQQRREIKYPGRTQNIFDFCVAPPRCVAPLTHLRRCALNSNNFELPMYRGICVEGAFLCTKAESILRSKERVRNRPSKCLLFRFKRMLTSFIFFSRFHSKSGQTQKVLICWCFICEWPTSSHSEQRSESSLNR